MYEEFKKRTLEAEQAIRSVESMDAIDSEFSRGFRCAMREAREIFLRVEEGKEVDV